MKVDTKLRATVLIHGSHMGTVRPVLLKNRMYYVSSSGRRYIKFRGLEFTITPSEPGLVWDFATNGNCHGDSTQDYNITNRSLPLIWKNCKVEIRYVDEYTVTLDEGKGSIVYATLENKCLILNPSISIALESKQRLVKYLSTMKPQGVS